MRVRMKKDQHPIILGVTAVPAYPEYFEVPPNYEAAAENLCVPGGPLERPPYAGARNADGTLAPADPAARPPEGVNTRRGRPCKPLSETPGGTAASLTERGRGGRFQKKAGV